MTTPANPAVEQANLEVERILQLVQQAVEENHNTLTDRGHRLGIHGHDASNYGLCGHYDCQLARTLRFTWQALKKADAAAETET